MKERIEAAKKALEVGNLKSVKFEDYTEYVPGMSNDGGCYIYWTSFEKLENGNFLRKDGTSCEMVGTDVEEVSVSEVAAYLDEKAGDVEEYSWRDLAFDFETENA